jgi:hypothetical protein
VPIAGLTRRRAVVADAETMVRTAGLGFATLRAFTPAGWSPDPVERRLAMARYCLRLSP